MEEKVSFQSDSLKIAGLIDTPPDYRAGERRPAFIVLHGLGGNKDGHGESVVALFVSIKSPTRATRFRTWPLVPKSIRKESPWSAAASARRLRFSPAAPIVASPR